MIRHGLLFGSLLAAAASGDTAAAQSAAYFSPTYAASEGSPYSEVYARAFGAGGPPLETSAPRPTLQLRPPPASPGVAPGVVYVIEDGRLLTYSAESYATGGQALARSSLPPAGPGGPAPEVRVPTIADRLYETPALETAAGSGRQGMPIPLLPRKKPSN